MQKHSEEEETASLAAPNDVESRPSELQEKSDSETAFFIIEGIAWKIDRLEELISSKIDRMEHQIDRMEERIDRMEGNIQITKVCANSAMQLSLRAINETTGC